jgi:hypothetical protein
MFIISKGVDKNNTTTEYVKVVAPFRRFFGLLTNCFNVCYRWIRLNKLTIY